jgi:hypothetical protein
MARWSTCLGERIARRRLGMVRPSTYLETNTRSCRLRFVQDLADAIPYKLDAIVRGPSGCDEMEIYKAEIMERHHDIVDLSSRIVRDPSITSASGRSAQQRMKAVTYAPRPSDSNLRSILILDDVLRTGVSVAAVVRALCERRPLPDMSVACLLWITMLRLPRDASS